MNWWSRKSIGSQLLALSILICVVWSDPLFAGTELRSGPARVSVLELYTSQGCNSCPPADEWMTELSTRPGLWKDYIPLAFHVDYWDYIGWKDRFARPAFGARQFRYQDEGGISTVYTPGMVLNGDEWRQWRTASEPPKSDATAGYLTADIGSGVAKVEYSTTAYVADGLVANVAILGFGLESRVSAGENRGRTLSNDFVVLGLADAVMQGKVSEFDATIDLPTTIAPAGRYAVVVWISSETRLSPLQAAGGWFSP